MHLVGVGGAGMSGIAELLVRLGYVVTGSDLSSSLVTERLESLGVHCKQGHDGRYVSAADLVVVSTAIPADNPEKLAAAEKGIPTVSRGVMLAELTSLKRTVAVVGSHGKTTTTAMVTVVLENAGLDPTAIIGGRVSSLGSNIRFGGGDFMVVEADESDRSFMELSPEMAVFTNIDDEHLDAYSSINDLEKSFETFAQSVAERGCIFGCVDDFRLRTVLSRVEGRIVTYGIDETSADIRAVDVKLKPSRSDFRVVINRDDVKVDDISISTASPGRHNVENTLAAIAVGSELMVPHACLSTALRTFSGAERRLQIFGEVSGIVVIDDYAHHPTEIEAVFETVRLRAPRRLRVVFQPHRYSRTRRLLDRFGKVLAKADEVILTEVYAANEVPISGATSVDIARAIAKYGNVPVSLAKTFDAAVEIVTRDARPGDVVVTLGAGSIGVLPPRITEVLQTRCVGSSV